MTLTSTDSLTYTVTDSPIGPLLLAATEAGLVRCSFGTDDADAVLTDLTRRFQTRPQPEGGRLDDAREQLEQYFAGERKTFDLALDWSLTSGFTRRVLEATNRIPYGQVASYRDVAAEAGNERATRAAGNALGSNPIAVIVPCHRVLRTGGGLGGYGGGLDVKSTLLRLEGVSL